MNVPFSNISRDDLLNAIGLQTRRSSAQQLLPNLGFLAAGLVVGGGLALLLAPRTGKQTRDTLNTGVKNVARKVASTVRPVRDAVADAAIEVTPRVETAVRNAAETVRTAAESVRNGSTSHSGLGGAKS